VFLLDILSHRMSATAVEKITHLPNEPRGPVRLSASPRKRHLLRWSLVVLIPESVGALDDPPCVACCNSSYRFVPCSTFERMGCISETTAASPFAKLAVI
jgi:hypothetical protein